MIGNVRQCLSVRDSLGFYRNKCAFSSIRACFELMMNIYIYIKYCACPFALLTFSIAILTYFDLQGHSENILSKNFAS